MQIDGLQLAQIAPNAGIARVTRWLEPINKACAEFQINTPARVAAFIAQILHESGELQYSAEIWGPSDAQRRYEGRKDLGNTVPGDGKRFKGRGLIQLTGRANYKAAADFFKLPLVEQPELAARPDVAARIAGWFWQKHGLNELADRGEFVKITKKINGGINGLKEREKFYARAKQILEVKD